MNSARHTLTDGGQKKKKKKKNPGGLVIAVLTSVDTPRCVEELPFSPFPKPKRRLDDRKAWASASGPSLPLFLPSSLLSPPASLLQFLPPSLLPSIPADLLANILCSLPLSLPPYLPTYLPIYSASSLSLFLLPPIPADLLANMLCFLPLSLPPSPHTCRPTCQYTLLPPSLSSSFPPYLPTYLPIYSASSLSLFLLPPIPADLLANILCFLPLSLSPSPHTCRPTCQYTLLPPSLSFSFPPYLPTYLPIYSASSLSLFLLPPIPADLLANILCFLPLSLPPSPHTCRPTCQYTLLPPSLSLPPFQSSLPT